MEDLKESKLNEPLTAAIEDYKNRVPGIPHVADMLSFIHHKEPEAYHVIREIIVHIHGTYSDKYQSNAANVVDTKFMLTKMKGGKWATMHSALKYIQRYISEGYAKSENPMDLKKAIHYIIFELTRQHLLSVATNKEVIEK